MKTIEVTVLPTGETKVRTQGFAGSECQAASKFLERALGQVRSDRLTDEFFQQATAHQSLAAGGSP